MDRNSQPVYKAFISYSHADEKWASWLHKALERYRLPKHLRSGDGQGRVLVPIFRDKDELGASADLSQAIRDALCASETLIVICSPASAASPWVEREIVAFRELREGARIIYCIVSGEPPGVFPPCVLADVEPLAADLRSHADGRRDGFLKIAAGMLDIGFDELRQRDLRVRQKRLATIAGGSLAGMLVAIVLAVYATVQQQVAERERVRAETEARTSAQVTEFMAGLFKVLDPAEGAEYSMTARELLDVGARRVEKELPDSPLARVRLMRIMGEVYLGLGQYDVATTLLEKSLADYTRLVPGGDRERLKNQRLLSSVYLTRGRTEEAARLIDDALSASETTWGADHPEVALVLRAHAKLMYARDGDAEPDLRRALAIQERSLEPNDPAIAATLIELGGTTWHSKTPEEGLRLLERGVDIYKSNYGDSHPDTQAALNFLGAVYSEQGDDKAAGAILERVVIGAEQSLGPDHPTLANTLTNLGIHYGWNDRPEEGEALLARALEIYERAYGPEHLMFHSARGNLAWAQHMAGKPEEAAENFRRALEGNMIPGSKAVILFDFSQLELDEGKRSEAMALLQECAGLTTGADASLARQVAACAAELEGLTRASVLSDTGASDAR